MAQLAVMAVTRTNLFKLDSCLCRRIAWLGAKCKRRAKPYGQAGRR
jgi:hypothetical protein